MIDITIFDFGGVIIDWNPKHLYRKLFSAKEEGTEAVAAAAGCSVDDVEALCDWFLGNICTFEWNIVHDAGTPVIKGITELSAQYPQFRRLIWDYYTRFPQMLGGLYEGTIQIMKDLKAAGYKVYGLSNWSAETVRIPETIYDFWPIFDGYVISGRVFQMKPYPDIYRTLLTRYNLDASRCVFIDDNPDNVRGADNVGIKGLLFTDPDSLRQNLRELGFKI